MKATIIIIGDEILLGQILDTNSRYIAGRLTGLGIETVRMYSISDAACEIKRTVEAALQESDVCLVTGGLGPTKDDITKKTLAEYFGTELVFHEEAYKWVSEFVAHYPKATMNECNQSQAWLPKDCTVLRNLKGTASGMWFEKGGKILVSLPGVPFEAEYLMEAEVLPRLEKRLAGKLLKYKMLTVFDVPEASLAMDLKEYEETLPEGLSLAYLPSPDLIRLRLTAKGAATAVLEKYWTDLQQALSGKNFSTSAQAASQDIFAEELRKRKVTVATAESCTGGNVAHLITAVAGSSAYYLGGVVSYANEVKENVLGVNAQDLARYGAVSEAVAVQMAQGARRVTGADYAVSTTGVAGPTGGTAQKPVGTVWIGVAGPQGAYAQEFHFSATRERNIAKASAKALELLLKEIQKEPLE
ncbi:MAG: competence/damage-inducible protein A [Elusimicrobiaceae bacterium]|nr:competence/damage-inducible protein A [Elusimicrobiaceae bacterium]